MGAYCPNCFSRVSHKWFQQYRFCSEYCRKEFILKWRGNNKKVPKEFR